MTGALIAAAAIGAALGGLTMRIAARRPPAVRLVWRGLAALARGNGDARPPEPPFAGAGDFHDAFSRTAEALGVAVAALRAEVSERERSEAARRVREAHLDTAREQARATAKRMRTVAEVAARVIAADTLPTLQDVLREACTRVFAFDEFAVATGEVPGPFGGAVAWRALEGSDSGLTDTLLAGVAASDGHPRTGGVSHGATVLTSAVHTAEGVMGVVALRATRGGTYGPADADVLDALAALAATAVRNVLLVDELRYSRAAFAHQALHDPLTGLPNRARLQDRLAEALGGPHAGTVSVLVLDLDGFKRVNDSLGHPAGDALLVQVAERLLSATRGSDTVARLGGDEFAVLLEHARQPQDAVLVAERVIAALRAPFDIGDAEAVVGTSVGIALGATSLLNEVAPGDDLGALGDALLRDADLAMYRAKASGKDRYTFFEPSMHAEAVTRLELEADLRAALTRDEFRLVYQPIVTLGNERLVGVEALVRWHHPLRGLVSPAGFVPIAEDTGLIVALGRWVLSEACRQARAWGDRAGGGDLTITVNVSGRQLYHAAFVDDVREALAASSVSPHRLVLEITETVMIDRPELALERFTALKALGVRLAIDDFGTGYSALSYLRQFPFDVLKIDKSFVDEVAAGGRPAALAGAIAALGDALSLRTVAEGVESPEQAATLERLGCELGQGYHFSRPVGPEIIAAWLAAGRARVGAEGGAAAHADAEEIALAA